MRAWLQLPSLTRPQQATGLDPALIDRSGDPQRKNPDPNFHTANVPPAYLHSEGKATLQDSMLADSDADDFPTEEDLVTLQRVPAKIPWKIYTVRHPSLSCT